MWLKDSIREKVYYNFLDMTVLLIGYGYWGKKIFSTLNQFGDLKILTYDNALSKLSLEDFLVSSPNFDHVFIATPEQTHYELVKKFLVLGKNVFVEKPLCLEAEQAEELVDLAVKNNTTLFVDYIFLYDNFSKKIREIISSNAIGKIENLSISRSSLFIDKPNLLVTDDLMIHDLYLLRYFFGKKISSLAFISSPLNFGLKQADFSISLDDKVKILASYSWVYPASRREMVFFGKKSVLFWKKNETFEELILQKNGKQELIAIKNETSPLYNSISAFLKSDSKNHNEIYNDYLEDVGLLSLARMSFYANQPF